MAKILTPEEFDDVNLLIESAGSIRVTVAALAAALRAADHDIQYLAYHKGRDEEPTPHAKYFAALEPMKAWLEERKNEKTDI